MFSFLPARRGGKPPASIYKALRAALLVGQGGSHHLKTLPVGQRPSSFEAGALALAGRGCTIPSVSECRIYEVFF